MSWGFLLVKVSCSQWPPVVSCVVWTWQLYVVWRIYEQYVLKIGTRKALRETIGKQTLQNMWVNEIFCFLVEDCIFSGNFMSFCSFCPFRKLLITWLLAPLFTFGNMSLEGCKDLNCFQTERLLLCSYIYLWKQYLWHKKNTEYDKWQNIWQNLSRKYFILWI